VLGDRVAALDVDAAAASTASARAAVRGSSTSMYASKRLQVARTTAPAMKSFRSMRVPATEGAATDSFSRTSKLAFR
jgi:hypothetical protein